MMKTTNKVDAAREEKRASMRCNGIAHELEDARDAIEAGDYVGLMVNAESIAKLAAELTEIAKRVEASADES